jgi:ABC-type multidrug transport system fused ATPase/permease subunit
MRLLPVPCCYVCALQVVFSYNPSPTAQPVLRGLSFLAPGGRSLAVVGSTGSGKSTLLRCVADANTVRSECQCVNGLGSWPDRHVSHSAQC